MSLLAGFIQTVKRSLFNNFLQKAVGILSVRALQYYYLFVFYVKIKNCDCLPKNAEQPCEYFLPAF